MSRYPRHTSNDRLNCNSCDGPVVKKSDTGFVCVGCGASPAE